MDNYIRLIEKILIQNYGYTPGSEDLAHDAEACNELLNECLSDVTDPDKLDDIDTLDLAEQVVLGYILSDALDHLDTDEDYDDIDLDDND